MKSKDIPLLLAFLFILLLFILCGCQTIPESPERDEELLRQSLKLQDNISQKLVLELKKGNAPVQYQNKARAIYELSEANLEWVGHPEEEWNATPSKLSKKMLKEDKRYEREITEWSRDMSKFEGRRVGGGLFSSLPWTIISFMGAGFGVGIFIFKKFL